MSTRSQPRREQWGFTLFHATFRCKRAKRTNREHTRTYNAGRAPPTPGGPPCTTPSDLPVPAAARAAEFYGPPPLNPGDDRAGYETLLARLVAEVRPRGVIEEDCVRLAADTMWEAVRTRRLKAKMIVLFRDATFAARLAGAVAAADAAADGELALEPAAPAAVAAVTAA